MKRKKNQKKKATVRCDDCGTLPLELTDDDPLVFTSERRRSIRKEIDKRKEVSELN